MAEKLLGLCLLLLQGGVPEASSEKMTAEVGKDLSLSCGDHRSGDTPEIIWNKDGNLFIKHNKWGTTHGKNSGSGHFQVLVRSSINLETKHVKLEDAGTFTCVRAGEVVTTLEIFVFQVLAEPSDVLIMTEDLRLSVKSSTVQGLRVSWLKDGKPITEGPSLEKTNVTIEESGEYTCHITMNNGVQTKISKTISVKGFTLSPSIVYLGGQQPLSLPFIFNFKVRESPLQGGVGAVEGDLKYLSSNKVTVQTLTVTSGAACWPSRCQEKAHPEDLSVALTHPKSGHYRMEIVLQIAGRQRRLHRDLCVANITVSSSHSDIITGGNVTLLCHINCLDQAGRLCWRHGDSDHQICGPPGEPNLAKAMTVLPETTGNWTCGAFLLKKELTRATLTLEPALGFQASPFFWVTVVVGVIVFVLIVTILTILIARHRRVRRARYRTWLIQNLHQHRRCECGYKGLAPPLFRQNI